MYEDKDCFETKIFQTIGRLKKMQYLKFQITAFLCCLKPGFTYNQLRAQNDNFVYKRFRVRFSKLCLEAVEESLRLSRGSSCTETKSP